MILKGLLVVAGGFLFIFSPGVPMRLISRFKPDYKREGLYWGIGIWIIAFFISTFLQNLVRQFTGGTGSDIVSPTPSAGLFGYLIGAVLTTLLVQSGMLIYLKNRLKKNEDVVSAGLALGFGIGLIAQVFTGLILISAGAGLILGGAGVELTLGAIQAPMIQLIAGENIFGLISALIPLIFFRIALLAISAVQGYLVALSLLEKKTWFWLAVLVYTLFNWLILILQLVLGVENPGQVSVGVTSPLVSIISAVYYLGAFLFVYLWLHNQLYSESKGKKKKK